MNIWDDNLEWPQTANPQTWAKMYCRQFPDADLGQMVQWFASALYRGYEFGYRLNAAHPRDLADSPVRFALQGIVEEIVDVARADEIRQIVEKENESAVVCAVTDKPDDKPETPYERGKRVVQLAGLERSHFFGKRKGE